MIRTLVVLSTALLLSLPGAESAGAAWPYPTSPFALGAQPTGLGVWPLAISPDTQLQWMWVGSEGQLLVFRPADDGSLALERVIALPAGTTPVSVIAIDDGLVVLDAAHDQLLVFSWEATTAPALTLPVGPSASALANGPGATIAVANAGSDDVSLFVAGPGPVIGPERRVAVGTTPVALALADLTHDDNPELVVANAGSGSISVLTRDAQDQVAVRSTVPVGGAPSALAIAELKGGYVPDLLIGDASGPRIAQLLWSGNRASRGPDLVLPTPASRANVLAVGWFDHDRFDDIAVADRGTATVWMAHSNFNGGVGPMAPVRSGVDAAGLFAGRLGGDFQTDLAIADARTTTVELALAPGDRSISAGAGATHLTAGFDQLAWSQAHGAKDYRLELSNGQVAQELPIRPSTRELAPHIGRRTPQRPVVSYVRCQDHSCRPFEWDVTRHRERPLHIVTEPGCGIADAAVWDHTLAYLVRADDRRCAARARGLWLRRSSRRPRRLAAHATIGALQRGRLAWKDYQPSRETARLRLLNTSGHALTLDRENIMSTLSLPTVDGHHVYWTRGSSDDELIAPPLNRQTLGPQLCEQNWPPAGHIGLVSRLGTGTADFAVDHGQLFYAEQAGVFQVDPSRLQWTPAC